MNDPEEKSDQEKNFQAVEKLLFFCLFRVEHPPLKHPVEASEIEYPEQPADQQGGAEGSEEEKGYDADQRQYHEGVSLDPAKGGVGPGQKKIAINRGRRVGMRRAHLIGIRPHIKLF